MGIDEFRKLREKDYYYYTDKTLLVKELMKREYEVTLFTRPRRFGKTLNMTMLKSFFEIGTDPQLLGDYVAARFSEPYNIFIFGSFLTDDFVPGRAT